MKKNTIYLRIFYGYALNNPNKYIDPDGKAVTISYARTQDKSENVVTTANVPDNLTIVDTKNKMTGSEISYITQKGSAFGGSLTNTYKDAKGKEDNVVMNVNTEINLSAVRSVDRAKGSGFLIQVTNDIPVSAIGLANGNVGAIEEGTIPKTSPAVILHELGHIMGLDHLPNALLDANSDGKGAASTNYNVSAKQKTELWQFLTTVTENKSSGNQKTMTHSDTRPALKKFVQDNGITQ